MAVITSENSQRQGQTLNNITQQSQEDKQTGGMDPASGTNQDQRTPTLADRSRTRLKSGMDS